MMREIKFRLIKDSKIVGYEKWYSGSRHSPDSGMDGWAANPRWLYSFDNKAWSIIYIEHDSKEQYIGLKANGKEIYKGDKVRLMTHWNGGDESNNKYRIEIATNGCRCGLNTNGLVSLKREGQEEYEQQLEIIGNIHEPQNPKQSAQPKTEVRYEYEV